MPRAKVLLGAASVLATGRRYYTTGKLSRAANANGNDCTVGKYDNNISGRAHQIFITEGTGGRGRTAAGRGESEEKG